MRRLWMIHWMKKSRHRLFRICRISLVQMVNRETYEMWCTDPYFDDKTKEELRNLAGDEKEIEDRFYRQLEFGTGGLRGMIGAGAFFCSKRTWLYFRYRQLATTRESTTDTRYIGKTVHRLHHRMTKTSLQKLQKLQNSPW